MIIWKGWGFLSPLIAVAFFFAGAFVGHHLIGTAPKQSGAHYGAAFGLMVAAVANWFIGRSLNRTARESKANVLNRHSFFFISMEWWSIVMLLVSINQLNVARE